MTRFALAPEVAEAFERDGFAKVPFADAELLTALRQTVARLSAESGCNSMFESPDPQFRAAAFDQMSQLLAPGLQALVGEGEIVLAGFLIKPAGGPELTLHRDWTMTLDPGDPICSLWCPLVDVDESNGALAFVPGMHRVRHISGPRLGFYWDTNAQPLLSRSQTVPLRAGEAVLFDNRIPHWSHPNQSGNDRPVATMTILARGSKPALFLPHPRRNDEIEVVDMSSGGFVEEGAAGCMSGAQTRPRLAPLANPNRLLSLAEVDEELAAPPQDFAAQRPVRLEIRGLSKRFCQNTRSSLRYALVDTLAEVLPIGRGKGLRRDEFWALDGIDLTLRAGEAVALLGENGSGKSTLLKIVNGMLKPTAGSVRRVGSIGAILELGTGLNPGLTGRENIELGATLEGVPAADFPAFLEEVMAFADLGEAIDAPFQTYSTGMKARLAYSLATRLSPDVLLVDEALAVGDMHFQRKCIQHMRSYVEAGGALLLVSHNSYQVQAVCDRAILLEHGKPIISGTAVAALSTMFERRSRALTASSATAAEAGIGALRLEPVKGEQLVSGEPARLVMEWSADKELDIWWGFSIWTGDMAICVTGNYNVSTSTIAPGSGELVCDIARLPLVPGRYRLSGYIIDAASSQPFARFGQDDSPVFFDVSGKADRVLNALIAMGQLATIEVDWR